MPRATPTQSPATPALDGSNGAPRSAWPTLLQSPPWREAQPLPAVPAGLQWHAPDVPTPFHWERARALWETQSHNWNNWHVNAKSWDVLLHPKPYGQRDKLARKALGHPALIEWLPRQTLPPEWANWSPSAQLLYVCGVAAEDVVRLATQTHAQAHEFWGEFSDLALPFEAVVALPPEQAVACWSANPKRVAGYYMDGLMQIVAHGSQAPHAGYLQVLSRTLSTRNGLILARGIASPQLAMPLAKSLSSVAWRCQLAADWLLTYPEAAADGLWPCALAAPNDTAKDVQTVTTEAHDLAWQALRLLFAQGQWPALELTLRRGLNAAATHTPAEVDAACDAIQARLSADPTRWLPVPLPKLTKALDLAFATATPLVLRNAPAGASPASRALPPPAMREALMVLMLGKVDAPYAGLAQLQSACTADSLAVWARDLLNIWVAEGMPPKARFLLHTQGQLGDDATATRLYKLIVPWRAKLDRVRAHDGIAALTRISGNAALTWLAALADQKRYDDLRTRAENALHQAAELRGMSMDELADCTLPQLGFDATSRQLLDFGPRQFEVLLDEQLQLRLRECPSQGESHPQSASAATTAATAKATKATATKAKAAKTPPGAWLKTLPKPRLSDDAALAANAKRQLKDVQTQLKAVAKRQLQRMEAAMCDERRWELAHFRVHLVAHPIARVLTQRLIFGVYQANPLKNKAQTIDTPLMLFRVAEDGTPTNAHDEALSWDDLAALAGQAIDADASTRTAGTSSGMNPSPAESASTGIRIGLPHPLAIAAMADGVAQSQALASLLADYELLQPFEQLGREVAHMPAALLSQSVLTDWDGRQLGTGSVMGLTAQGWQRAVGDGGMIDCVYLTLPHGLSISLSYSPGWFVASPVDTSEGQTVESIRLDGLVRHPTLASAEPVAARWADVSPISRSEVLRSLNRIAWWHSQT